VFRAGLSAGLGASLVACAGAGGVPSGPTPAPEVLWARLRSRPAPHTLQAEARVSYFGEEGRVRLRATLVAQRPDRFRLETLSPFEEPIDLMISDGQTLWWLSQGTLREGRATPEKIGRLLPLPLHPRELVSLLLGGLPADAEPVRVEAVSDPPAYRLDLRMGDRWTRLWVDADADRILRLEVAPGPDAPARVRAEFEGFEDRQGFSWPTRIHGETGDGGTDLRIRLTDMAFDRELPERVFRFDAGPGVPRAPW
jgi:hypothetical protein